MLFYKTEFLDKGYAEATGKCIVLITPDKERTMNTYLGATEFLTDIDIDEELIAQSEWLYLEGYRFDGQKSKEAFYKAIEIAKKNKTKIAITLSDSFCVDRHRSDFIYLLNESADMVFCNEDELKSLYQIEDIKKAREFIDASISCLACTCAEKGAYLFHGSSISEISAVLDYQIPLAPLVILGSISVFLPQIFDKSLENFTPIQKSAYLIGLGGTVIFLGALCAYVLHNPEDELLLWPLIIIPISALVAIFMYMYGKDASFELNKNGLVAGVLPKGMTENEYLEIKSPDKDLIENLRWKAVMSYPIVFLAVSGQIFDGLATFVGLEYLGYSEKHVVSERIIDWSRENFDTAAAFILVKVGLGGLIWWFYTLANFEYKQQHLRLLVGLAMMVVGLAPGLRDILRMALGV